MKSGCRIYSLCNMILSAETGLYRIFVLEIIYQFNTFLISLPER